MRGGLWWWLPPAVAVVLAVLVGLHGSALDPASSRAGAEPVVAGLVACVPFVLLALVQVACAAYAGVSRSRRVRTRCLAVMTLGALAVAALVLLVETTSGADVSHRVVRAAVLLAGVGLPLVPLWAAAADQAARSASRART